MKIMDTTPNPALADLLSADDLKRIECLYITLRSAETDFRNVSLVLAGLTAKYASTNHDLVMDLLAAHTVVDDSIKRAAACSNALGLEFVRIMGERQAAPQKPAEVAAEPVAETAPHRNTFH